MIGTVANWSAYAEARGLCVPSGALASQALLRASDYIMLNYVARFADGFDEASPCVAEAVYEAATLEAETPGFFSSAQSPDDTTRILTRVGEIEWEQKTNLTDTFGSSALSGVPVSSKIHSLLSKYLGGTSIGGTAIFVV